MTNAAKKSQINSQQSVGINSAPERAENYRILVVDDEPEIVRAYQNILTPEFIDNVIPIRQSSRNLNNASIPTSGKIKSKYQLTVAHSAAEAFHYVQEAHREGRPFAMGFIDVLLGEGMDGIELVKNIQKLDPEMYFVFVTAYQDRSVDAINDLLGADVAERWDYLNKPFSEGEISQKARNATTHWNLKKQKELRDKQLADLQKRSLESERLVSVATVARGMGHEFGNILVQIIGRADLAKRKNEKDMKEAFDQIIKAGELAAQVLDRFKNLARSTEGSDNQRTLIRISQSIEDALLLLDHQIKISNIKICRTKNDQSLTEGCSAALTQVFVNLFINSLHAMNQSPSGQIDISVARIPDWTEIKVRDYGPGIDASILSKVTDAFFTTKGADGTGLGLSICKEIIEIEHEGQFEIKNHHTKGVEVTIRLPHPKNNSGAA